MIKRTYFFDGEALSGSSGLCLKPVTVEKTGILTGQKSPEDLDGLSIFSGSVVSLKDKSLRMYCSAVRRREPAAMRLAVLESNDGINWKRPVLNQQLWRKKPCNHLRIEGLADDANITQPVTILLPDDSWIMYCWLHDQSNGRFRYLVSTSKDGLQWKLRDIDRPALFHPADREVGHVSAVAGLVRANPEAKFNHLRKWNFSDAKRLRSNDATTVYFNPAGGEFEMYSVWLLPNPEQYKRQTPHDNAPGILRFIQRRTSSNGFDFSDPELVILPDESDPATQQFYGLSVYFEQDWRIGFASSYHCWEQTVDCELCFSRDGRNWLRPFRGGFIPRGPVPQKDCMTIYASTNLLNISGNRHMMLYRGGNAFHNHKLPEGVKEEHWNIMGAVWLRNRFAALSTIPGSIGKMTFKTQILSAAEITLDAQITGSIRAELRDTFGAPLKGYELHACNPLGPGDGEMILRWGKEGESSACFRSDPVILHLELDRAAVYSVCM
jgi:hypothetical protein